MKIIDLPGWKRREHFEFFSGLDDPYWSVVAEVDCTQALKKAHEQKISFFLCYLHASLMAANEVEEFRYRIKDGQIVCYEVVHASATVLRDDETFGCSFMEFSRNLREFAAGAQEQITITRARDGMCLEKDLLLDQIHYSSLPWIKFKGLTYVKNLKEHDTVPKITFGKYYGDGSAKLMPVAVQVHHGLVDGLHMARFLEKFQAHLNQL